MIFFLLLLLLWTMIRSLGNPIVVPLHLSSWSIVGWSSIVVPFVAAALFQEYIWIVIVALVVWCSILWVYDLSFMLLLDKRPRSTVRFDPRVQWLTSWNVRCSKATRRRWDKLSVLAPIHSVQCYGGICDTWDARPSVKCYVRLWLIVSVKSRYFA